LGDILLPLLFKLEFKFSSPPTHFSCISNYPQILRKYMLLNLRIKITLYPPWITNTGWVFFSA
jgi:hypothetical protein